MKKLIFLYFIAGTLWLNGQIVICNPNGVSTDPANPINYIQMPIPGLDPEILYFENHFEWFGNDGLYLDLFPLYDMDGYEIGEYMSHPFSNQNQSYRYLLYNYNVTPEDWYPLPIEELDMYPEDGWELLSVNLGFYPNLTPFSLANHIAQSSNDRIPYILLYNKKRGLIRIFVNYPSPPGVFYDKAKIIMKFTGTPQDAITSGLLRYNDGVDIALEEYTNVREVSSIVKYPNVPEHWMHADFQVGYDPCTCLFGSSLDFNISLVDYQTLEMSSRSITANINLLDANGNLNVDANFIPNTHYDPLNDDRGLAIFKTMGKMAETYRINLRAAQIKNAAVNANNAKIKKQIAVLNVLEQVLKQGLSFITPAAAVAAATANATAEIESFTAMNDAELNEILDVMTWEEKEQYFYDTYLESLETIETTAPEIVEHVDPDGTKHFNLKKLHDLVTKNLAGGFDEITKHLEKGLQNNVPLPSMPTGSMTETSYSGEISNESEIEGWTMFNPGTYFYGQGNVAVDPNSYPIYNEVLGLFALLNTPKIIEHKENYGYEYNTTISEAIPPDPLDQFDITGTPVQIETSTEWTFSKSFQLGDLLKYAINPAAPIDLENVEIFSSIIIDGSFTPFPELTRQFSIEGDLVPDNSPSKNFNLTWNETTLQDIDFSIYTNNFEDFQIAQFPTSFTYHTESDFIHLDNFKDQIFNFSFKLRQNWSGEGDTFPGPSPSVNAVHNATQDLLQDQMAILNVGNYDKIMIKLIIRMPMINNDPSVESYTEQLFTYSIPLDCITASVDPLPITWSVTENPNSNGSLSLQENIGFEEKNWTSQDFSDYGGFFIDPPQNGPVVRSYATESIHIYGNQSISQSLVQVQMIAGNEISVTGDVTIFGDIVLKVENFIGMSATPNPPADETYLVSFCSGLGPNTYNANQLRHSDSTTNLNHSFSEKRKDVEAKIQLFPNPASKELNLSLSNISGNVEFAIFNSIGVLMSKHIRKLENSYGVTNISFDISSLPEGSYTLIANNEYRQVAERFIVIH